MAPSYQKTDLPFKKDCASRPLGGEEKDGSKSEYCPLNQLKIKEGEAYYFTGIRLTLKKDGPYQLAAVWDKGAKEAWLIVSNLPDPTILTKIYPPRGGQGHC